jgi:hypothetical protein
MVCDIELVAMNNRGSLENLDYLLKYDTVSIRNTYCMGREGNTSAAHAAFLARLTKVSAGLTP